MTRPVPVWHGAVDPDGVLRLQSRALFDRYLETLKNAPVQVTVKRATRRKSRSQLGYYWGVVIPVIAESLGYHAWEHQALHDAMMRRLRGLRPDPNPLQLRVSLAEMDLDDTRDYIDDVRFFAAEELGIVTPDAPAP